MALESSRIISNPIKVGKNLFLIFLLSLIGTGCRQAPPTGDPVNEGGDVTSTLPTERGDVPGSEVTPTPIQMIEPGGSTPVDPTDPTPTFTVEPIDTGPQGTPTRLPEPRLIKVLDWELVQSQAPDLCAGCGPSRIVVPAPRRMGIVLVRIFGFGESAGKFTVSTDLAYASPLACEVSADDSYCGAIFGQVVDGKVLIMSEPIDAVDHEIIYYLTFQRWAEYSP
jgi:hypothetical protein